MVRIITAALALLSLGTGCVGVPAAILAVDALDNGPGYDDSWVDTGDYAGDYDSSNATGFMRGDLPHTGNFDRGLTSALVYSYGGSVELDLHSTDGDWAMLGGGFETQGLEDGETVVLGPDEHWVFGCSGDSEWNAQFDEPADTVEVTRDTVVIDGEPMIELTVTATWTDDHEVTAVVVKPQPNQED